jgi:hypothetical protein
VVPQNNELEQPVVEVASSHLRTVHVFVDLPRYACGACRGSIGLINSYVFSDISNIHLFSGRVWQFFQTVGASNLGLGISDRGGGIATRPTKRTVSDTGVRLDYNAGTHKVAGPFS